MPTYVWNREELYSEVWEAPLVKLTAKYGASSYVQGNVCRKLPRPENFCYDFHPGPAFESRNFLGSSERIRRSGRF